VTAIPVIDRLDDFASPYTVIFCDVWGVLHNGIVAYPAAGTALNRFRQRGGTVILVSNAPRPGAQVIPQLDHWGVRRDAYDLIITSGDLSRVEIARRPGPVLHIGPERDLPLFSGLEAVLSKPEEATYILCTGLYDDENETVEDYYALLKPLVERHIPFICANPDLVVERGKQLIPCAGAIAIAYEEMGGTVFYAGKPHREIYEAATQRVSALRGKPVVQSDILAIGDALRTDIAGAHHFGIDSLLIARGIHMHELMPAGAIDAVHVASWLNGSPFQPQAVMDLLG
jgi:HAD superfamily hydrolase (TIGR01459 family)